MFAKLNFSIYAVLDTTTKEYYAEEKRKGNKHTSCHISCQHAIQFDYWTVGGLRKEENNYINQTPTGAKSFHIRPQSKWADYVNQSESYKRLRLTMKGKVILPWCHCNQQWQCYPNTSGHTCHPAFEVESTSLLTITRGDLQVKAQRATRVSIAASGLRLDANFLFHRRVIPVAIPPLGWRIVPEISELLRVREEKINKPFGKQGMGKSLEVRIGKER